MTVEVPKKFKITVYKNLENSDPSRLYGAQLMLPCEKRELVEQPSGHKKWQRTGWRWSMFTFFHGHTEDEVRAKAHVFMMKEIDRLSKSEEDCQ